MNSFKALPPEKIIIVNQGSEIVVDGVVFFYTKKKF